MVVVSISKWEIVGKRDKGIELTWEVGLLSLVLVTNPVLLVGGFFLSLRLVILLSNQVDWRQSSKGIQCNGKEEEEKILKGKFYSNSRERRQE